MTLPNSQLGVEAGQRFIASVKVNVLEEICKNSYEYVNNSPDKLDYFMKIMLPFYTRFKGKLSLAVNFLKGILRSVKNNYSNTLQETVIDSLCFIYSKLNLVEYRKELIEASTGFCLQLKSIIASSLELEK